MLNKYIKTALILSVTALTTACDFEEKNVNPNNNSSIKPGPLLTYTQLNTCRDANTKNMQVGTCMMLVQQTATLNSTEASAGDKYYLMKAPSTSYYNDFYSTAIKNWRELEIKASQSEAYQNMLGVAKIWGAYLFQRMTDLYGNVPYSEAGLGYYEQIYTPKYDNQEEIYKDMIEQVKVGIALLDPAKPDIEGDLFYDGNIENWKKFGNSLLLRLGMRLCKVDPALAKETAALAVNGGIMDQAKDLCRVKHVAEGRNEDKNPLSLRFARDKYLENDVVKISSTFLSYLKATNDPRIKVYCSLNDGNNNPADQKGLPNGYDKNNIGSTPGFEGIEKCSNMNINTILKMDAPTIMMFPSEGKLLQAEAALRGWVPGDAQALFNEAVTLSMQEQAEAYGMAIAQEDIDAYLAQDLFGKATSTEAKLEVLGCQFWVASFMDSFESYANWRRSGYPVLQPTHYEGNESNGQIPRRILYSTDDYTVNKANVDKAIKQQGPDNVNTRVWWDK